MSRTGDSAVGMMDSAYFVGRGELLIFFNELMDLQLAKIEQTASGAIACQLTEYIFPGSIPMSRVNWEAKSDYEFISNYKLLQVAFNKNRVQRHVDVSKLIRAKYQDNLEFCQWLKAFYDQSGAERENYDPNAVRAKGKGGKKYNDFLQKTAAKHGSKPLPAGRLSGTGTRPRVTPASASPRTARPQPTSRPTTTTTTRATGARPAAAKPKAPLKPSVNNTRNVNVAAKAEADAQLKKKNVEITARVEELESSVVELEKERDFYFGKLRNIELMLQVQSDKNFEGCDLEGVVGNVFKVLYATAEEDVAVGEDGEIIPANPDMSVDQSAVDLGLVDESAVDLGLVDESAVDLGLVDESAVDLGLVDQSAVDLGLVDLSAIAGEEGDDEDLLAE